MRGNSASLLALPIKEGSTGGRVIWEVGLLLLMRTQRWASKNSCHVDFGGAKLWLVENKLLLNKEGKHLFVLWATAKMGMKPLHRSAKPPRFVFDRKLSWEAHIGEVSKGFRWSLSWFESLHKGRLPLIAYCTLFHSHLAYRLRWGGGAYNTDESTLCFHIGLPLKEHQNLSQVKSSFNPLIVSDQKNLKTLIWTYLFIHFHGIRHFTIC